MLKILALTIDLSKEDIIDELVIALFIEDITEKAANFYSEYYVGEIAVYNYEVTIVYIGKMSGKE